MPAGGGVIAAVVGSAVIGGLIGMQQSAANREAARTAAQQAVNNIQAVGAGPDLARQIYLKEFQKAGILTPETEKYINQNSSELSKVQGNASAKNAQMEALQSLRQRAQIGLSPEDKQRLAQIQQQTATEAEGKRQQILQNFAARGQGGSGNELLAELTASQNATQNASNEGLGVASMASQNALQALSSSGQLAGQIEGQDFGEAATRANAADQMQRFNIQNQLGVQAANVNNANAAQSANLANAQSIQNANTSQYNTELQRQRQAEQQMYLNKFNSAVASANALNNQATNLQGQANATAQQWQNIGSGVGQGVGAIANYNASSKNKANANNSIVDQDQKEWDAADTNAGNK